MTPEEYKRIEIEKFLEYKQGNPLPEFVRVTEEYVKIVRLVSYEDVRKRFFHDMDQTDETDCVNKQYSH